MDACREQGVEEPVWRWDGGFVIITFKRPTYELVTHEQKAVKEDLGADATLRSTQVPLKHPLSTPQVELLIQKMSDSYMTLKEIAESCGIRDLKYFRESFITPALEIGVIERLYPNQPKHPKQQYRLTDIKNKQ